MNRIGVYLIGALLVAGASWLGYKKINQKYDVTVNALTEAAASSVPNSPTAFDNSEKQLPQENLSATEATVSPRQIIHKKAKLLQVENKVNVAVPTSATKTSLPNQPLTTISTAVAAKDREDERQAHYEAEILYSTYAFREPGVYNTNGNLAGFRLGGEYDFKNSLSSLHWDIDYFTGSPTFNGNSARGVDLSKKSDSNFYTFSSAWGYRKNLQNVPAAIETELGLAYRYLDNRVRDRAVFQREQIYLYVPALVALEWQTGARWMMRASLEGDVLVTGQSRQHLNNIDPSQPVLKLSQNTGTGAKLALGARTALREFDVTGEIYYRNWDIAQSKSKDYVDSKGISRTGVEEANTTEMFGAGVGISY